MNSMVRRGPHPGYVALVLIALTVAQVAGPPLTTGNPGYIDPTAWPADITELATRRGVGLRLAGFLLIGSAVPLLVLSATWAARLREAGLRVPGPYIALAGGISAAGALALSGTHAWLLGAGASHLDRPTATSLAWLAFLGGGVGFTLPLGLLLSGIAVPGLLTAAMPRPLAVSGLLLAAVCELSWLSLAAPLQPLTALLPVARFGGLLWLVAVGFSTHRRAAR